MASVVYDGKIMQITTKEDNLGCLMAKVALEIREVEEEDVAGLVRLQGSGKIKISFESKNDASMGDTK